MFDPVYRNLFEQRDIQLLILIPRPKQQQYSFAKVTFTQESKSNCMWNFKKEHLLGVHQTADVAKPNSYQSYTHNITVGVHLHIWLEMDKVHRSCILAYLN